MLIGSSNEEKIWNFLKSKGLNDNGCAGLLGNLSCESSLKPNNLQDTYNRSIGMTDDEYVKAVDNGSYTKNQFVKDCAGFGLAQWTLHTRKNALYEYVKSKGVSIGDLETQLEFLIKELSESYSSVLNTLKTATSVIEASNAVLLKFECPADQSASVQNKRASYGQGYYNKYAKKGSNVTMAVKTYQENDRVQLSKNFNSYEFRCGLGSPCSCSTILIDDKLVEYLQMIRDHFGKSVTITSAYRCTSYNKKIGGATSSYHSRGMACDIVVSGVTPREVAKYAESIGILGIGLYETSSDGHFVHIDTRTTKSFWYGQGQAYRSTFGGATSINNVTSNTSTSTSSTSTSATTSTVLKYGSSGDKVKKLQKNLISLGYSLGNSGADGDYGSLTEAAVIKFQGEYGGLGKDGKAGNQTLNAINAAVNSKAFRVKITANVLNVRSGAGTNYDVVSNIRKDTIRLVLEEKEGWGKISNGWIKSNYYKKI